MLFILQGELFNRGLGGMVQLLSLQEHQGDDTIIDNGDKLTFNGISYLILSFFLYRANALCFDVQLICYRWHSKNAPGSTIVLCLFQKQVFTLRNDSMILFSGFFHREKNDITIKFVEIYRLNMVFKNQNLKPQRQFSLNCRGRILVLDQPRIMGILNLTPDSFSDGGDYNSEAAAVDHVGQMLVGGVDLIDIGGYSSRPGATHISPEAELERIFPITQALIKHFPQAIFSVDTFRAEVAQVMLEAGVHLVNDISAGRYDADMLRVVANFDAPFLMMHMQGTPQTMQQNPTYENIVHEVWHFFIEQIQAARQAGIRDLIIDPGFGFGKSISHNYQLVEAFDFFRELELPLLAGISRKSMMYKLLDTTPHDVLEITTALHLRLLDKGANILRVHDVAAARRIIEVHQYIKEYGVV